MPKIYKLIRFPVIFLAGIEKSSDLVLQGMEEMAILRKLTLTK